MKKKILKILAFVLALCLLGGVCFVANGLVGNPVSAALAERGARAYLSENHADENYEIVSNNYDFKIGGYYIKAAVAGSLDKHFVLYADFLGNISHTTYENDVLLHGNTADRLNGSYAELCDKVLLNSQFSFETDFSYGMLEFVTDQSLSDPYIPSFALRQEDFETDVLYDVYELGAKAGHLITFVRDENVSVERLAEILLEIRNAADRAGLPFFAIDCALTHPRPAEGDAYNNEQVQVDAFLYTDIYEEGLVGRVQTAYETPQALPDKETPIQ